MLNPGTLLQNRYQIIQRIGGGGMGEVYLAYDLRLGNRQVVVKENRGGDARLFHTEANILANLTHSNLPRVSDHFIEAASTVAQPGAQYLVMDYIAGQTLEQIVQQHGALLQAHALGWFAQIFDAVKYLHANRIVHRDIKPQNIIITPQGKAMLVDFGIAKVLQAGQATLSGAQGFGSPGYAPPEQYTGGTDERSDVYALGATLYYALTGADPLSVPERASGNAMPAMRARNTSVTPGVESAVTRALRLPKPDRFQNVVEFEQALQARASGANDSGKWLLVGAGVGALAVLVLGALIAFAMFNTVVTPTPTRIAEATRAATVAPTPASQPTDAPTPTPMIIIVTVTPSPTPTPTETPRVTPTPRAGDTRAFAPDNAPMQFVPAGEFTMGSDSGDSDEKPVHTVYLDAFWMDRYEVTNTLYAACVNAGKCTRPSQIRSSTRETYFGNAQYNNYPVIYVDWNQAKMYCEWAGKRLPTEAEWEKAARGTDGRVYPWGNSWDVRTTRRLNFSDKNDPTGPSDTEADDGYADTAPVGTYPNGASPYGIMDLSGNVWEWVADWYDEKYYASSPRSNPTGPSSGQSRVLRGGAWDCDQGVVRAANRGRFAVTDSGVLVGFRCARGH